MADFSELVDRAEARFRDTANDVFPAVEWGAYINDAYRDVHSASAWWPFHEALGTTLVVAAQDTGVDLPTNVWRVDAVFDVTDNYPLAPVPGRTAHLYAFPAPGSANFSIPTHYRVRQNRILVYPNPPAATTIHVEYREPPDELSGTDVPLMPEQYHHMLVEGALYRAYMDDGNPDQAERHKMMFDRLLEQMKDDLLSSRHETYHEIVDDWGYWGAGGF